MVEIEIVPNSIELIKLTDEEYFSPKYKDYISNSRLGFLNEEEDGSEEKFLSGFKSEYSDSFELGSAVHSIILQPDSYFISSITKPSGKLGVFVEKVFNKRQSDNNIKLSEAIKLASEEADYYSGSLSATRMKTALTKGFPYYRNRLKNKHVVTEKLPIYLSETIKLKAEQCISEIQSNRQFIEKLKSSDTVQVFNEYAIFCEVKVIIDGETNIVKLKGKLDNFTVDTENEVIVLNDLKTTGKPVRFFMGNKVRIFTEETGEQWVWYDGSFQKYHYYRQMAIYAWLLKHALYQYYNFEYKIEANMLVVETIPNYKSAVYKVPNKSIQAGLKEFKELLTKLVQCQLQTKI